MRLFRKLRLLLSVVFILLALYGVRNILVTDVKNTYAIPGQLDIGTTSDTEIIYYYNKSYYANDILYGNSSGGFPGVITHDGYVLVNLLTPTPGFRLNVNGRSYTHKLSVSTNATDNELDVAGTSSFQGNVGVGFGNAGPYDVPLTVYQNSTSPNLLKLQGSNGESQIGLETEGIRIAEGGAGYFYDNGAVTLGNASFSQPVTLRGSGVNVNKELSVQGTGNSSFAGRVGIGTTAPGTMLQIQSPAANTDVITLRGTGATPQNIIQLSEITGNHGLIDILDSSGTVRTRLTASGTSYFTGGNVGIGTSTPLSKLHVQYSPSGLSGFNDAFIFENGAGNAYINLLGGASGGESLCFGRTGQSVCHGSVNYNSLAAGALDFRTGDNQYRMVIDNAGQVGIGTTIPSQKLTISGTGSVFGVDNTATFQAKNTAGTYETYLWPRWSDDVTYLNFGAGGMNIRNSASASRMFIQNGGNVGIGVTGPVQKLDVSGNVRLNHVYSPAAYTGFFTDAGAAQPVKVGSLAIASSYSNGAPTNGLYVQGAAGIGTTTPGATLHVAGASGNVFTAGATTNGTGNINLSGHVQLREHGTGALAYLQARDDASNRNIGLRLRTQKAGGTTPTLTEALTIDQDAKIYPAGQPAPRWASSMSSYVFSSDYYYDHDGSGTIYLGEAGNNIDIRGDLGIGTTAPGGKIDVVANLPVNPYAGDMNGIYVHGSGRFDTNGVNRHGYGVYSNIDFWYTGNYGAQVYSIYGLAKSSNYQQSNWMAGVAGECGTNGTGCSGVLGKVNSTSGTLQKAVEGEATNASIGGFFYAGAPGGSYSYQAGIGVAAVGINYSFYEMTSSGKNAFGSNTGIGNYYPQTKLHVSGSVLIDSGYLYMRDATNGNRQVIRDDGGPTLHIIPWGTGPWNTACFGCGSTVNLIVTGTASKPGGGSWAAYSDARLKKDITPYGNALESISRLQGVKFRWINENDHTQDGGIQGGFIAQDVEKAFPAWVTEQEPVGASDKALLGKGVKAKQVSLPQEFSVLIVEAIKELHQMVKNISTEIKTMYVNTEKLIVNGLDVYQELMQAKAQLKDQERRITELEETVRKLRKN